MEHGKMHAWTDLLLEGTYIESTAATQSVYNRPCVRRDKKTGLLMNASFESSLIF